jgi:hypothetical protein
VYSIGAPIEKAISPGARTVSRAGRCLVFDGDYCAVKVIGGGTKENPPPPESATGKSF